MRFYILISLVLASACNKKGERCETWEFYNRCVPKTQGTVCVNNPPTTLTGTFCDEKLDGVYPGAEILIHEDADAKIYRHFVQKK